MHPILLVFVSLLGIYLLQIVVEFWRTIHNVGHLSGPRLLFDHERFLVWAIAKLLPPIPYVSRGGSWMLRTKHQDFAAAGQDATAMVTMIPWPSAVIYLADAAAIKEVATFRAKFPKPVDMYEALFAFGGNIIASEGEDWKRYRTIAAPAFSERNTRLVWDETIRIMFDLFDNVWGDSPEIVLDHCVDITLPIALFVIGVAGFGRRVTWTSDLSVPPGHQMPFKDALHIVSTNLILKMGLPNWAMKLTERTRRVNLAFDELRQYMVEMVNARRSAETREERHDLFNGLLDAADDNPDGSVAITEQELIGNMFIFLLAGHETTAHTLCFTFALLALHPDEQERLYQQIKGILVDLNGMPTYEDMNRFTLSMAVLYETLRMFPPVSAIPKRAAEDTSLTVSNADGGETTFPIPSGTRVDYQVPGLHYNPKYWKDPHTFRPERFLGEWPRNAFLPFSSGARGCLGRRFFETESVAAITMMILKYRVEVKDEPEFVGETFEQRYARITAFDQLLNTAPRRVPLVFKRR
ncbi:cytochrome P450 [Lactarius akahatsu]|uniref:Cytochrome P450 n=1 Tax=Lactarius akahatsu TaxID=416441 RepID=A0AAD4LCK4_9AGAM|nr:cytochrome P450 [Lactarius akahatsu]